MRDIIDSWFAATLAEGTTKNVNTMAPFLTLAYLYEETGDPHHVPYLDTWAEWADGDHARAPRKAACSTSSSTTRTTSRCGTTR